MGHLSVEDEQSYKVKCCCYWTIWFAVIVSKYF